MATKQLPKSFQALVEESDRPVLVDFWAAWCGPCHAIAPVVEQIAKEYKGRMLVTKVNIDEQKHLAFQYQVQSIPTIMIFYKGKILARQGGALPYGSLKHVVDRALEMAALP